LLAVVEAVNHVVEQQVEGELEAIELLVMDLAHLEDQQLQSI
tara:strand:- start:434 stop:559 length:126 start_codon:yes stop_codon:yes gene_type:complete